MTTTDARLCGHHWPAASLICGAATGHDGPHHCGGVKWLVDTGGTIYAVTSGVEAAQ